MNFSHFPALTLTAALALGATTAQAVEMTGGSVGLTYSTFTDETDLNRVGLEGSVELGFPRNFSLQIDAAYHDFDWVNAESTLLGLHGIYHMNAATSFGLFYTREKFEGEEADIAGVEVAHEIQDWRFEGYIADTDSITGGTFGGVQARYEMSQGFGLTGYFDRSEANNGDLTRFAVRLDRDVSPSTNLFIEVGSAEADFGSGSETEPFVALGGKIMFGADRSTTFEQRGLARLIPGL
ncbi:hypothetical protein [Sulfitobacter sp. PS-8MA]|uniref:hypothetical protein n=1 Tax=Sulfitobacter sp. PS-8MA TaxID=3237707 RepID=UPI0034C5EEF5